MTPAEQEALREIGAYLGALAEDLAQCAESVAELAGATEALMTAQAQMQDALTTLTGRFVQMHDEQRETNARLNLYLDDATRAEHGMRQLRSEVREVDKRLKVLGG